MSPGQFLFLIVAMTMLAAGLQWVQRQRHLRRLRDLAGDWKLHFSSSDCFRLAPRVAMALPVPGAAAVRVTDLIYGLEDRGYRYIFRTEYTLGVLRTKTGVRRIGTFKEPRDAATGAQINLVFAPDDLPFVDQYRHLYEAARGEGEKV